MLNVYADFCEEILAIPVLKGVKTDKEKFALNTTDYIHAADHDKNECLWNKNHRIMSQKLDVHTYALAALSVHRE